MKAMRKTMPLRGIKIIADQTKPSRLFVRAAYVVKVIAKEKRNTHPPKKELMLYFHILTKFFFANKPIMKKSEGINKSSHNSSKGSKGPEDKEDVRSSESMIKQSMVNMSPFIII
jgi:hypothetical protein